MSAPLSLAQEKEKKGLYVAAEVGQATLKDYCSDVADAAAAARVGRTSVTCSDSEIVLGADVGYQFNEYIAAELGGRIVSGYEVKVTADGNDPVKSEIDYTSALLGVRGSLPLNDKFSVHVNTGFHVWKLDAKVTGIGRVRSITASTNGTDPYYGVGADFSFSEKISTRVNFTRAKINDGDIDYISGAVVYRF